MIATATRGEALSAATDALRAAGVDSPRLDAELLLAEASGVDRGLLVADPAGPVEPAAARAFAEMVRRRLRREPVAYITGRRGFRRIELTVDSRVLIPRPETELLVEVALGLEPQPLAVLDVGTGSGAVALAIADELPAASVVATDTSPAALELARSNAAALGLADRVRFEAGSLPADWSFDLIVANLPYVSESEWEGLAPEIREFEPRAALVPEPRGETGLEAIETLLGALARDGSVSGRAVALEHGAGQSAAVAELVRRAGWDHVQRLPDLAGIDRVVLGAPH